MSEDLVELELEGRKPRDVYRLLIGLVIPRPIAWVTTRGSDGRANAAPFSFFNVMAEEPPLIVLGLEGRRDAGAHKDTTRNILETGEFVVHIVDRAHAEAMNRTAVDFPSEIDELAELAIPTTPGAKVNVPRIATAPALMECRRYQAIEVSARRIIMIGEIVHIAVAGRVIDPVTERIDARELDAIARLGGPEYCTTRDWFAMPRVDL
jgi:flavin reductase (DIM6/NTAB) family NADH-FMN oxidoreductase RutF